MRAARDLGILLGVKASVGALVLAGGFRAVSDDDFARVVLAQQWVAAPRLDPTGTSWLPAPFWIYGMAMRWAGTSLEVARVSAFAFGLGSTLLLYLAARLLLSDERAALWGALCAAVLPWSARLGVATVPELPTAALTVLSVATLASRRSNHRLLGAAALTVACLSRYEPWLVAPFFAAVTLWDLRQGTLEGRRLRPLFAAALALLGPALWLAHNALAHGAAFHFLARVSAYKKAVGGVPASLAALVAGYPLSLLREEPEICILAVAALVAARVRGRALPASLPRTAALMAVMLVLLSVAALPGGAPTHHAGRALLALWLVAAIYVGAAARAAYADPGRLKWGFALLLAATLSAGAVVLRPWYARLDSFTARPEETAIGAAARKELAALRPRAVATKDARILLEVEDYRFFAVQAGSGLPDAFVLDRDIDPRRPQHPSSFASLAALEAKVAAVQPDLVVAELGPVPRLLLGEPRVAIGSWGLWRVPDALRQRLASVRVPNGRRGGVYPRPSAIDQRVAGGD